MTLCNRLPRQIRRNRLGGQTLVELVVSMTLATVLMLGLGSCLFIASSAFDGSPNAVKTSRAAEIQADMMIDLNQARSFTSRTADTVTFTVPDRDNDGSDETLTYTWTGSSSGQLRYTENGKHITLLKDVRDFRLTYLDRFLSGTSPPLPALDPDQWGHRWRTDFNFGNETIYPSTSDRQREQIGTRVTLSESGTLQSISAYFTALVPGSSSDVRMAIYDTDAFNVPNNLLASTATISVGETGWLTATTPPVVLDPGEYYLTLSVQNSSYVVFHYESGTAETHTRNRDACRHGFTNPWGPSNGTFAIRTSIYASCNE